MCKIKKIMITVILGVIALGMLSIPSSVKAATAGPMYLGIMPLRSSGWGYKQANNLRVWKIAQYNSEGIDSKTVQGDTSNLIYCIKGGSGFGSTDSLTTTKKYSQKFNLKDKSSITTPYTNAIPNDTNYNKLMWVIDHLYTGIKDDNSGDTTAKNNFLANIFPDGKDANGNYICYEALTDNDIDVVQQLAIWYFTNPTGTYHIDNINLYINRTNGTNADYATLSDVFGTEYQTSNSTVGTCREDAATALYNYFINNASSTYNVQSNTTEPITLVSTGAQMQTVGSNYIAGPYKITDKGLGLDYTLTASFVNNGTTDDITSKVSIVTKDNSGNYVTTTKTLKELVGTEFYLQIPTSSNINGIDMTIKSSYPNRTAEYWSVENAPDTEQPVVLIKDAPQNFESKVSIIVQKPTAFDLSLRKFITSINGVELKTGDKYTREPVVDVTQLKNGTATTATYNHTKEPLKVAVGDIITYTIRVYNEGKVDGYANEITDHLPANLVCYTGDENNEVDKFNATQGWLLDKTDTSGRTVRTQKLSKTSENTAGENKLLAFDNRDTLDYRDVQIKCIVTSTTEMPDKITNIADITAFVDGDGKTVTDRDSSEKNVKLPTLDIHKDGDGDDKIFNTCWPTYEDANIGTTNYIPGQEDDDDFEKVQLKAFDLSLRKYITNLNGTEITSRIPQVDTKKLDAGQTTATYNHTKNPVSVAIGDTVIYTIRVYNEGEVDGYANEITDHLPAQLEFLADNEVNKQYGWTQDASNKQLIKTTYLSKTNGEDKMKADTSLTTNPNLLVAYDGKGGDSLTAKSKYIQVACKVVQTTPMASKITNIADITDFSDSNGNIVKDRDSEQNNVNIPADLPNYNGNGTDGNYTKGQQDDDDFEKLMLKEFDLSLRKYITNVNGTEITSRIPQVDVSKLNTTDSNGNEITTATYNHTKDPVKVSVGDTVIYTVSAYNEGGVDGYANEITDHLPAQLEFLPDNEVNKQYGWTQDNTDKQLIKTTYLSKANGEAKMKSDTSLKSNPNLITAFDGTKLYHQDIKVACKVIQTTPMVKKITNIADITDFSDSNGNTVKDRDSSKDNVKIPSDLPNYEGNGKDGNYTKGQEDDDDFEKLEIGEFDLSLRKFITAVNTTEITSRIPQVDVSKLNTTGSDGKTITTATYNHTKEPVLLASGCVVTYTIRVYNEGDMNGYAKVVKDDIPEGLEFLPDNDLNKTYRWIMLDKDGKETTTLSSATTISTDYLSKEQGEARMKNDSTLKTNPSLLKAFDGKTLDYKDLKIAFKVTEPNTSDRIIINQAQIAKNTNENGTDVTDRDSTPDKWIEGEDDQDIEKVKVQYFDLALRKWVTQAIVIDNGQETVTETGHKAEDDPEGIVKVDLKKKKIDAVTVKFRYKIRVTNQGQIAGYAKEIKDYIPEGLKFVAQDNPLWTAVDDQTITTDQAKDILLKPGESTEVEVLLTWINGNDNLGLKTNIAEISKDYNEFNSPDIDSTPNNKKSGEDDIDDAPVMLSVQTGQAVRYFAITGAVLIVLAGGIVLIKKFVI